MDYEKLYSLQDRILGLIFSEGSEFYLTGGTCLHRFYFSERYSDDLDLFTHSSHTFAYSLREIKHRLTKERYVIQPHTETKDFVRFIINDGELDLQVDFINDRLKRFGNLKEVNGVMLDNPLNILSNKLTAVLSRDNPKDIFDICVISQNIVVPWKRVLEEAKEKAYFQNDQLIYRLESFPKHLLKSLQWKKEFNLSAFESEIPRVVESLIDL